jgi:dissimilatory sulfite reductase (desulfoviridin) alpha/beta subunit
MNMENYNYISKLPNKPKVRVIENNAEYGIYVWKTESGKIFGDGDGNFMNIPARKYDIEAIKRITQAAAHYGAGPGKAQFMAGVTRITDEEHSVQVDRMKNGLIASEFDTGAWADAAKGLKVHGND